MALDLKSDLYIYDDAPTRSQLLIDRQSSYTFLSSNYPQISQFLISSLKNKNPSEIRF